MTAPASPTRSQECGRMSEVPSRLERRELGRELSRVLPNVKVPATFASESLSALPSHLPLLSRSSFEFAWTSPLVPGGEALAVGPSPPPEPPGISIALAPPRAGRSSSLRSLPVHGYRTLRAGRTASPSSPPPRARPSGVASPLRRAPDRPARQAPPRRTHGPHGASCRHNKCGESWSPTLR